MNLNYTQLTEINLLFSSINQLHHQVISINLQTEISLQSQRNLPKVSLKALYVALNVVDKRSSKSFLSTYKLTF